MWILTTNARHSALFKSIVLSEITMNSSLSIELAVMLIRCFEVNLD